MRRLSKWLLCCGLVLLATLAVSIATSGGSCGGTLASGRAVFASSDTLWMASKFDDDTSHLSLGSLKVDVEPTQVIVEGEPVVNLDARTKSVRVTRADGRLTVVADGATVYDAPLAR